MAGFGRWSATCAMKSAASHRRRIKLHSITHAGLVHGALEVFCDTLGARRQVRTLLLAAAG
ncbi:hypothetical protein C9419_03870 [Paraburkholderia fungorum]|nr:hypothetical protein C9419_03870 [Paraburkholderia fungorum]